ncbi:hypothetical protein Aperf_G00000068441 [Anoplocephala perfoliata]
MSSLNAHSLSNTFYVPESAGSADRADISADSPRHQNNTSLSMNSIIDDSLPDSHHLSHQLVDGCKCHSILIHRDSSQNSPKSDKHVSFGLVELYHFDRLQGFTCVPSQGGSTLGMASKHWIKERVPVADHQTRREYQRHSSLLRFCLEGKLLLSFQQFRLLESRVKHQQRLMTQKIYSKQNGSTLGEPTSGSLKRSRECVENPSDGDLSFLDGLEEYYFLQPLPVKKRRVMLRKAGISKIDSSEKQECEVIRKSRTACGCTCIGGLCDPRTCECALNGIPCQVDRTNFPCVCLSPRHCANSQGRVEFNPMRVRTHYLHTRLRLEAEERAASAASALPLTKRSRLSESDSVEAPVTLNPSIEDLEEGQTSSSSSSQSSSSICPRSVEEALNATASNGGCRDCQDDRYVRLLMQELQSQQHHQQQQMACNGIRGNLEVAIAGADFAEDDNAEELEGEAEAQVMIAELVSRRRRPQGMLSDNLAVDSASFLRDPIISVEDEEEGGHELTSILLNTEDEEYEDEEDDEDSEDSDFDIVHEGELVPHLLTDTLSTQSVETDESTGVCRAEKTDSPTPSLCRLEPITSLFHSPSQDASGSSPETEGDGGSQSPTSASPRTATSVCEAIIA